ncbi:hypothetical protein RNAN_2358 [Rheinheimera nanhaiensis E407-8]|uniref:Uncharacterized protein n=1 Tax=Rheinheimera nanhaiensis E407-8 TaxID=562729 RepID=I1DZ78_9GAMM|nr:hypothetical protein RNAN_2358 [Rheinheimera nanhaiensis E407-8]
MRQLKQEICRPPPTGLAILLAFSRRLAQMPCGHAFAGQAAKNSSLVS